MKLVLITQYKENYGYRWKNKGGWRYYLNFDMPENGQDEFIEDLLKKASERVEYKNEICEEYIIDWSITNDELQIGEFDEPIEILL